MSWTMLCTSASLLLGLVGRACSRLSRLKDLWLGRRAVWVQGSERESRMHVSLYLNGAQCEGAWV